jgi:hypothetical protein
MSYPIIYIAEKKVMKLHGSAITIYKQLFVTHQHSAEASPELAIFGDKHLLS